jgi:hypothetical protein
MFHVGLDGSRRIESAHIGCAFGPDGSRRIQMDHLDDQTDDQSASGGEPDDKTSKSGAITFGAATITLGSRMTMRDLLTALQTLPREAELLAFEAGCGGL